MWIEEWILLNPKRNRLYAYERRGTYVTVTRNHYSPYQPSGKCKWWEPSTFFEVNGERKCSVKYFNKTSTFELEVYQPGEKPKTYQFDNIDMIAIEILI